MGEEQPAAAEMEEEQPAEMEEEQQPAADMEEERPATAGRQLRLKEDLGVPGWSRVLNLVIARPAMIGRHDYEGPTWKKFSTLHVHLGGCHVASLELPVRGGDDMEKWWRRLEFRMGWEWPRLHLCLEVVREDCGVDRRTGRVVVFRADEPHTSGHTAAIGAATVPLLDALVLGDDDDDEDAEAVKKKMELEEKFNPAKGTQVFQERVKLQGWREGAAGGEPTNVVCGSVVVRLYLSEHEDDDGTAS